MFSVNRIKKEGKPRVYYPKVMRSLKSGLTILALNSYDCLVLDGGDAPLIKGEMLRSMPKDMINSTTPYILNLPIVESKATKMISILTNDGSIVVLDPGTSQTYKPGSVLKYPTGISSTDDTVTLINHITLK